MSRKTSIVISISVYLLTIFNVYYYSWRPNSNVPIAENGALSIENWNFNEDGVVKLDGNWDFYPNELITPNPLVDIYTKYEPIHKLIKVPAKWDELLPKEQTPYGVGTYRLIIQVPKDDLYGIKVNTIRNANRVYINGVEVGAAGNPSKDKAEYRYDFKKHVVFADSINNQIELVVLVANYEYARGGIVTSLIFGTKEQIIVKQDTAKLLDIVLISGYILFAVIYFITYFQRKKYIYELFFSFFCLFQGLYNSTVNERWLFLLFPHVTAKVQVDIQMTFISLSMLFFILFVYRFFYLSFFKKGTIVFCTVLGVLAFLFGICNPLLDIFRFLPLKNIQLLITCTVGISYMYILIMLLKVFKKKIDETEYVRVTVTSFMAYGVLLGLEFFFEIYIVGISLFLFLLMVASLSLLMNHRSQVAFYKVEELSKELLVYDQLKDEFLAKTSHELSTPLHGILNLSKSLMEGVEGPLKRQQQESVILIHNIGRRLANLVEDLLFSSNIKNREISAFARPINMDVIEDVLAEMVYLIPATKSLKLINKVPTNLPLLFVDEHRLKQVLFNLIYNAITYTHRGKITIHAEVHENEMQICVEDTGIGIKEEHFDLLFSTFYQIENSGLGKKEGLGLGLSITKQIVESSGGRIWVTSEVGQGSRFTFTIPLADEKQKEVIMAIEQETEVIHIPKREVDSLPELPRKISGKKAQTILVVDDEYANLKVLINIISSLEYNLIAVDSGEAAIEILKEEKIDLMIVDVMMPEMSGYELCNIVRMEYDLVELPIIILTAAGQLTDLIVSFQAGANDFLQKPVDSEELKVRIESLLAMKKSAEDAVNNELGFYNAQITPHFLYNTLNTIIGLSYQDEEKTREALEYLSIFFRAKLDYKKYNLLIPLEDEIELAKAYLAIEKMRFGDRLTIEYYIDETIEAYLPSMTIQPLVENAVQHGISKKESGGILKLSIQCDTSQVIITIEDNGVGIPLEKQKELLSNKNDRIGFTNPFKKLKLIKKASFKLESEEGIGTKITISLPGAKEGLDKLIE
ncbi:ATP-binding protein [Psychrobacillus sp.]|uniref:hybrid sensor histidine kinase/response regulator n=1 Tax=Psychrobacillus sp. TaxID=1871623 RepID=UPI0028BD3C49|nr:ATP-binding protein [Psychrobacillus sp.]